MHKDKKSGRTVVALGAEGVVVGRRYAAADVLALEGSLQLRRALTLPRLREVAIGGHLALLLAVEVVLQALEGDHHDRDVIESLLVEGQLHDVLHCPPAELVDALEAALVSLEGLPHDLDHLSIGELIVDAVA